MNPLNKPWLKGLGDIIQSDLKQSLTDLCQDFFDYFLLQWCCAFSCMFLQELEDFENVSDFEVLMKSSHSHNGPNGPDRDEFNNHKDYNQEKPSKLKQR